MQLTLPTVLVIDDSPENIDVLKNILQEKYRIIAATSGAKGLQLAERDPVPDVILLDIHMPDMDGYEVCQELKKSKSTYNVPVIFITGDDSIDSELKALRLGAVDYVTKPFNPQLVSARVATHTSIRQYQTNLQNLVDLNIAELKKQYEENMRQQSLYKNLLDSIEDSVFLVNQTGQIELANPSVYGMFGYTPHELIGQPVEVLIPTRFSNHRNIRDHFIHSNDQENLRRYSRNSSGDASTELNFDSRTNTMQLPGDLVARRKDNSEFPVTITLSTIVANNEKKFTAVVQDMTARKHWESKLTSMAMQDPLTGLANRTQFEKSLNYAWKMTNRLGGQRYVLMLIDLDDFKPVNDQYGHPVGDKVLKQVARILLSVVREVDTVARLGGDEFAIIYAGEISEKNINKLAQRILSNFSSAMLVEGHKISLGCSIGVFVIDDNQLDEIEIVRQADAALYESKKKGKNTVTIFHNNNTIRLAGS